MPRWLLIAIILSLIAGASYVGYIVYKKYIKKVEFIDDFEEDILANGWLMVQYPADQPFMYKMEESSVILPWRTLIFRKFGFSYLTVVLKFLNNEVKMGKEQHETVLYLWWDGNFGEPTVVLLGEYVQCPRIGNCTKTLTLQVLEKGVPRITCKSVPFNVTEIAGTTLCTYNDKYTCYINDGWHTFGIVYLSNITSIVTYYDGKLIYWHCNISNIRVYGTRIPYKIELSERQYIGIMQMDNTASYSTYDYIHVAGYVVEEYAPSGEQLKLYTTGARRGRI